LKYEITKVYLDGKKLFLLKQFFNEITCNTLKAKDICIKRDVPEKLLFLMHFFILFQIAGLTMLYF